MHLALSGSLTFEVGENQRVEPPISFLYPLIICYIAIENGSLTIDLPIPKGDFPVRYQRVIHFNSTQGGF